MFRKLYHNDVTVRDEVEDSSSKLRAESSRYGIMYERTREMPQNSTEIV